MPDLGHGELGHGEPVFEHPPVTGRLTIVTDAEDVLELLDNGAEDAIVLVRDAGATFLSPVFPELRGVICTGGTPRSHIGIVSREFQVPCLMGFVFTGAEPGNGDVVELDCSAMPGTLRRAEGPYQPNSESPLQGIADESPAGSSVLALMGGPPHPPSPSPTARTEGECREVANRLIAYHSPIAHALTVERTSYRSQLIPVTPYILVACAEAFYRYPEMIRVIDAAMPAQEIARAGRRPGSEINTVHLWSIANFFLVGRKVVTAADPSLDSVEGAYTVLDFWERAARAFRADGTLQAWDSGGIVRPYDRTVVETVLSGCTAVDDDLRARAKRFNATLVNYLFLMWFDTRTGATDVGPYPLADGRCLVLRDYQRLGPSDFWWSDVAAEVPYHNLTAALILQDVDVRITDFGSSYTDPENYLDHLVGFGLFTTDGDDGALRPVALDELDDLTEVARRVNAAHYRNIAAMSRDEMIRCGAYVYFTFLRPFAQVAGVEASLDWTVPRDLASPVYEFLSALDGDLVGFDVGGAPYYPPLA